MSLSESRPNLFEYVERHHLRQSQKTIKREQKQTCSIMPSVSFFGRPKIKLEVSQFTQLIIEQTFFFTDYLD